MDELRQVIEQELRDCVDGPPRPGSSGNAERVANAVRAYLASDGVVDRSSVAVQKALNDGEWTCCLEVARAALTAATKGDGDA